MNQPQMTFNDGNTMPQLGAGTWQIPEADTPALVRAALEIGYRLIDTAAIYGNETGVGQGLRDSSVPRDEVFVTTKLWNADQGFDRTLLAFDASMTRLGLDYLDLYLIHWPMPMHDTFLPTWRAIMRLQEEGRIRSIGVANFHEPQLRTLIRETGATPVLNQIELHPRLTQQKMRAVDDKLGIITQSWSPLGQAKILDQPEIVQIAETIGKTPAQVILRWHLQHRLSVIPKTVRVERLQENFDALDFTLSDKAMAALDALDDGTRFGPDPEVFDRR